MTSSSSAILVLAVLLLANQILHRSESLFLKNIPFYALQTANLTFATWIVFLGFPGFENFPAGRYAVAVILAFRAFLNHHMRRTRFWELKQIDLAKKRFDAERLAEESNE